MPFPFNDENEGTLIGLHSGSVTERDSGWDPLGEGHGDGLSWSTFFDGTLNSRDKRDLFSTTGDFVRTGVGGEEQDFSQALPRSYP